MTTFGRTKHRCRTDPLSSRTWAHMSGRSADAQEPCAVSHYANALPIQRGRGEPSPSAPLPVLHPQPDGDADNAYAPDDDDSDEERSESLRRMEACRARCRGGAGGGDGRGWSGSEEGCREGPIEGRGGLGLAGDGRELAGLAAEWYGGCTAYPQEDGDVRKEAMGARRRQGGEQNVFASWRHRLLHAQGVSNSD